MARISSPRRRTYRVRVKWDPSVIGRRFKIYVPGTIPELNFELDILMELERRVYAVLQQQAIPTDQWENYIAFTKRLWERGINFEYATFTQEKTSLVTEFTLRGLNPAVLAMIQVEAEAMAELKLYRLIPPAWTYDNLIGAIYLADPVGGNGGYYDNRQ